MPTRPSAATRPAFFAAFAKPFVRNQSIACSILPSASFNAALQSIMPAPVVSRSSFTMLAVISAISLASNLRLNFFVLQMPFLTGLQVAH